MDEAGAFLILSRVVFAFGSVALFEDIQILNLQGNNFPTGHHETSLNVNVVQCFVILRSMEGFLLIQVLAMYQTSV